MLLEYLIHAVRFQEMEIEREKGGKWHQGGLRFEGIVTLKFGSLPCEVPRLVSPDDFTRPRLKARTCHRDMRRVKLHMIRVHGHYKVQFTRLFVEIACWIECKKAAIFPTHRNLYIFIRSLGFICALFVENQKSYSLYFFKIKFNCKIFFNASTSFFEIFFRQNFLQLSAVVFGF